MSIRSVRKYLRKLNKDHQYIIGYSFSAPFFLMADTFSIPAKSDILYHVGIPRILSVINFPLIRRFSTTSDTMIAIKIPGYIKRMVAILDRKKNQQKPVRLSQVILNDHADNTLQIFITVVSQFRG